MSTKRNPQHKHTVARSCRMQSLTWLLLILLSCLGGVNVTLLDSFKHFKDYSQVVPHLPSGTSWRLGGAPSSPHARRVLTPPPGSSAPESGPPASKCLSTSRWLTPDISKSVSTTFPSSFLTKTEINSARLQHSTFQEKALPPFPDTTTLVFSSYPPDVRLGILNNRGCSAISQIKMYYKMCPQFNLNFATFPAAIAASSGIRGHCAFGFVPLSDPPSYDCLTDGYPGGFLGTCGCDVGLTLDPASASCKQCPPSYFKNWRGNSPCKKCPPTSHSPGGSSRCFCNSGLSEKIAGDGSMYCLNAPSSAPLFNVTVFQSSPGNVFLTLESRPSCTVAHYKLLLSNSEDSIVASRVESSQLLKVGLSNLRLNESYKAFLLAVVQGPPKSVLSAIRITIDLKIGKWLLIAAKYVTLTSGGDVLIDLPHIMDSYHNIRVIVCTKYFSCEHRKRIKISLSTLRIPRLERGQYTIKIYGYSHRVVVSSKNWSPVIAGSVVFAFFVFLFLFLMRRKLLPRPSKKERWYSYPNILFTSGKIWNRLNFSAPEQSVQSPFELNSFKEYILDSRLVSLGKCLSEGEKSRVHLAKIKNSTYAAKKIDCSSESAKQNFINEVTILSQLGHRNVTSFVGIALWEDSNLIIFRLMREQSLDQFLRTRSTQKPTLSMNVLIGFLSDISAGMEYLSHLGIIHRDLAARNVLLDQQLNCRVSDFGLACKLSGADKVVLKDEKIPVKWTAPECFRDSCFTIHSDVWSFGILAWEVMSLGDKPYFDWSNMRVIRLTSQGYRLPPPVNCPKKVYKLFEECWSQLPPNRPSFRLISLRICEMMRQDIQREVFNQFVETSLPDCPMAESPSLEQFLGSVGLSPDIFCRRGIKTVDELLQFDPALMKLDTLQRQSLEEAIFNYTNRDIYCQF